MYKTNKSTVFYQACSKFSNRQSSREPVLRSISFPFTLLSANYQQHIWKKSQKNLSATKKAVRIIVRAKNTEHAQPIFLKLKILPYELIVKQSKLNFMHSIKFNYAPESLKTHGSWTKTENMPMSSETILNFCYLLLVLNFFKNNPCTHSPMNGTNLTMSDFKTTK